MFYNNKQNLLKGNFKFMECFDLNNDFIKKMKVFCQEIIQLKSKNIDNNFNIFTEMSDIYWRENFHSDIHCCPV
jgi:hypothetical protein